MFYKKDREQADRIECKLGQLILEVDALKQQLSKQDTREMKEYDELITAVKEAETKHQATAVAIDHATDVLDSVAGKLDALIAQGGSIDPAQVTALTQELRDSSAGLDAAQAKIEAAAARDTR